MAMGSVADGIFECYEGYVRATNGIVEGDKNRKMLMMEKPLTKMKM